MTGAPVGNAADPGRAAPVQQRDYPPGTNVSLKPVYAKYLGWSCGVVMNRVGDDKVRVEVCAGRAIRTVLVHQIEPPARERAA